MDQVTLRLETRTTQVTEIEIGVGVRERVAEFLTRVSSPCMILTHPQIRRLHSSWFFRVGSAPEIEILEWPEGEGEKSWGSLERLLGRMLHAGLTRRSHLVICGGGVLGDLGGLAAALYMRGIPCHQVPTTLLAQVDSAVGGKTAVDTPWGKNLVGLVRQPERVWIDPLFLTTLPDEELLNGMGEVVKYGVLMGDPFFARLEEFSLTAAKTAPETLGEWVRRCVEYKVNVVQQDPDDRGPRHVLNLGHTVGHALESMSGYRRPHGQSVLLGLLVEARIAARRGLLPQDEEHRIRRLVERVWPQPGLWEWRPDRFYRALTYDKKGRGGEDGIVMVLPAGLGRPQIADDVRPEEIEAALVEAIPLHFRGDHSKSAGTGP